MRPLPPDATIEQMASEVTRVAKRLMKAFPHSAGSFCVAGQVKANFGNSAEALELWERCVELDPRFSEAYRRMGMDAMRKGEHERAADLLRKALLLGPGSPDTVSQLAKALMSQGKMDEAKAVLQRITKSGSGSAGNLFLLGEIHLQLKDYAQAKKCFQAVLKTVPDHTHAYFGLFTTCARLGEKEKSREYRETFKKLRTKQQETETDQLRRREDRASTRGFLAGTYWDAGRVYFLHGNLREAEAHWQAATALEPDNPQCLSALAELYERQRKTREALRMLQRLLEIQPDNPFYRVHAGQLHAELNEFQAAEEAFRDACRLAPASAAGFVALAEFYVRSRRNLSEAIVAARKATQLRPTARNFLVLSAACESSGDMPGAFAALDRAIELEPGNPVYREAYQGLKAKN